jgi:hypothetical protein
LEQRCEALRPAAHLSIAFVDADGRVLDDRSAAAGRWVGRHYSELPSPVTIIGGVDPLRALGLIGEGEVSPFDHPESLGAPH